MVMFAATALNTRNQRVEGLFKTLFGLMTGLLILPVLIILGCFLGTKDCEFDIAGETFVKPSC